MDAPEEEPQRPSRSSRQRRFGLVAALISLLGVILLGAGILTFTQLKKPNIKLPPDIAKQVAFPIYLPQKLPDNYVVEEKSFSFQEEVLVFRVKNDAGGSLIFSEQRKPDDFDFDGFYKKQFKGGTPIDDAPYTSVRGKVGDGRPFLSIVTDETWIFMTSSASLSDNDMQGIANGLKGV